MAKGFGSGANVKVEADKPKGQAPSKKVITGKDLRMGK